MTVSAPPLAPSFTSLARVRTVAPAPAPDGAAFGRLVWLADRRELPAGLLEAVREARTVVKADLQLLKGPEGQALARLLASRARQGLRVQILAWGEASPARDQAIAVARSQGLAVRRIAGAPGGQGLLIADDRQAWLGAGSASAPALRVGGEAARELGRTFNQAWIQSGGTPATLPDAGPVAALAPETLSAVRVASAQAAGSLLVAAIGRARRTIVVAAGDLGDGAIVAALQAATRRGVAVRLLAGPALVKRAGTLAALQRAGVQVRGEKAGSGRSLDAHYAVIDGDTLVYGATAWGGFGAESLALEARGGRTLTAIQAGFNLAWERAVALAAPSPAARLHARLRQLAAAGASTAERFSPLRPLQALLGLHVGVVKLAGRWRVIAEVR